MTGSVTTKGGPAVKESRGVTGPSFQLVALAIALAFGTGARVLAADELEEALSNAGKVWYGRYCTPCHGPDGAPGDAVSKATKQPVDLRTYVRDHGGKFPAADWLAVIADARPASVHANVWKRIRQAQTGTGSEAAARGVVGSIAHYVVSFQTK
jgi:mono/diheme cytochrome c family protein